MQWGMEAGNTGEYGHTQEGQHNGGSQKEECNNIYVEREKTDD